MAGDILTRVHVAFLMYKTEGFENSFAYILDFTFAPKAFSSKLPTGRRPDMAEQPLRARQEWPGMSATLTHMLQHFTLILYMEVVLHRLENDSLLCCVSI